MTQAHHGDEGRRQAYLAALGIPLWSARIGLPGALPSAPLAYVPFVAEVATPAAAAPAPVPSGADQDVPGSVPEGVAPDMSPATPAPVAASAAGGAASARVAAGAGHPAAPAPAGRPVVATAEADAPRRASGDERFPRLSCRAWTLAPGYSAVIPLDDAPDLSAAEYRLLDNIARALDAGEMPSATGELLRWPLNRNPALDHGPEALHAWLGHALRLPPGRCVVFGEALAAHVAAALPGAEVVAAPSLGELLAEAGAKRRLWQVLHG